MKTAMHFAATTVAGALFVLLTSPLAARGAAGEISGSVRDESGTGLSGATVSLSGQGLREPSTRQTDGEGRYRFTAVAPGAYDLGFSLEGFAPEKREGVSVADGGRVIVTATLRRSRRYTLALTVDSGSTSVITSDARVTTSTQEANPGDESASEDTTITTRADLSITKTDSVDPVVAGTPLTYTLTVANKGPSDARFVEVSDTLPAGVTFTATSGCQEDPAGVATCTLGTIPAGGSKRYTVTAMVKPSASGSLTNQASVSSQTVEAVPGDESTSESTAVDARADLSIAASDSADPAVAGTPLTYAVTVSNGGPSDAREVVVTAGLGDGVRFDSTSGCSEDPRGLPTCTLGTIPAGGSKQVTVAIAVASGAANDLRLEASVAAATTEVAPGNESVTESTAIGARADLSLTARASTDPVIAGTPLAYALTVANNGPSDARGVVITGSLPAGVTYESAAGCDEDPGVAGTCTLGTIPAGGSKQATIALTVGSGTTGTLAFRASVDSATAEAGPGDESASVATAVDARADLVLTSRDSVDPVVAGLPLVYTLTVVNNGPSDARDVVVSGSLPAGVTFESTSGCAEDGEPGGGVSACTLGTIPAGGSKQYTISVVVNPDATGVITNQANVSSSTTEGRPGDERVPALEPRSSAPPASAVPAASVPEPAAEAAVSGEEAVAAMAREWARAWSEQRIDDYLALYASGFRPPGGLSRDAWQALRSNRILSPRRIEVRLSGVEAQVLGAGRGRVRFNQAYRSDTYDDDVRKTLELVREDGRWKILEERTE